MARILIVEDEETLRIGMMRALAKLPQVQVAAAGNVREALALIDSSPPDAVISDLDLPDRFGAELLGELDRRGLRIPVTFVSAFTRELGERVPRSPRVRMVEKPLSLERLREIALAALSARDSVLPPPFGPSDYLQLACLGRHSVVITHREDDEHERAIGKIVVWRGQLWSARDEEGEGEAAFRRMVTRPGAFRCHSFAGDPGPRQIEGSWEMLLLDAMRIADEAALANLGDGAVGRAPEDAGSAFDEDVLASPLEPSTGAVQSRSAERREEAVESSYDEAFERGVAALLTRNYGLATRAFAEALAARPGDALASANLERLRELGHESGGGS